MVEKFDGVTWEQIQTLIRKVRDYNGPFGIQLGNVYLEDVYITRAGFTPPDGISIDYAEVSVREVKIEE